VTDYKGGDDYLFGKEIVAGNGLLNEMILAKLTP